MWAHPCAVSANHPVRPKFGDKLHLTLSLKRFGHHDSEHFNSPAIGSQRQTRSCLIIVRNGLKHETPRIAAVTIRLELAGDHAPVIRNAARRPRLAPPYKGHVRSSI
jgi:hypothetical protein